MKDLNSNTKSQSSRFGWEIRIISLQGETLSSEGKISCNQGAPLVSGGWVRCRGVIPRGTLPIKGRIEVRARGGAQGFEVNQFEASTISTSHSPSLSPSVDNVPEILSKSKGTLLGGDYSGWSHHLNQASSLRYLTNNSDIKIPR
jgi:hypothetical protein